MYFTKYIKSLSMGMGHRLDWPLDLWVANYVGSSTAPLPFVYWCMQLLHKEI